MGGATALQRCLARVARFEGLSHVLVATTTLAEDDLIVQDYGLMQREQQESLATTISRSYG